MKISNSYENHFQATHVSFLKWIHYMKKHLKYKEELEALTHQQNTIYEVRTASNQHFATYVIIHRNDLSTLDTPRNDL